LITRETDYAVRAMMYLAIQEDITLPVSSAELAAEMEIPYRFLRKIVLKLIDSKLVTSRRGKGGGLNLALSPDKISLFEIMHAVDPGGVTMNICLPDESKCSRTSFCGMHSALIDVQKVFDDKLKSIMLSTISAPDRKVRA
jgi:Rrf2 family nitric oxide-sensitive transcriptional repressor